MMGDPNSIAIVGMAGLFPGAPDLASFWQRISAGEECLQTFTETELDRAGVAAGLRQQPNYVRRGGVLPHVECFDAAFFGFSPREAAAMDPQHRLFLQLVWHALEDAGYDPDRLRETAGVFVGTSLNTYLLRVILGQTPIEEIPQAEQVLFGNAPDYLPTRIAYLLDLHGPSVGIQTACSTSLVAIHQACQALLYYQCDLAIAGGVTVKFPATSGYRYRQEGILSPDGHCRPFDAQAAGTVFTSGAGVVILKRLEQAQEHGDAIHAIIRGSAINNDGSRKVGYTAPSVAAQAEVVALAQDLAEVDPDTVTYVEAHGTGTKLGDPIEVAALTQAFRRRTARTGFCALTSLKAGFGHMDAAAGVAGVIKTCLALRHETIPRAVNFESPNPEIDFESSPFYVPRKTDHWASEGPRRAGVSSFGIGGANAHVVLQEAPTREQVADDGSPRLLIFSARTPVVLDRLLATMSRAFESRCGEFSLNDASFTLAVGRRQFEHRAFVVASDLLDAGIKLKSGRARTARHGGGPSRIHLVFSGQLSHPLAVLSACCETWEEFRLLREQAWLIYREIRGDDRQLKLFSADDLFASSESELEPLRSFVISYATASVLRRLGLEAETAIAFGLAGRMAAGCWTGAFSFRTGLKLLLASSDAAGCEVEIAAPREPVLFAEQGIRAEPRAVHSPAFWLSGNPDASESGRAGLGDWLGEESLVACIGEDPAQARAWSHVHCERMHVLSSRDGSSPAVSILQTVGEAWLRGVPMNWEKFSETLRARRCHLPGYPFERAPHWYRSPAAPRQPIDEWFYVPSWKPTLLPLQPRQIDTASRWLILRGESDMAEALAEKLRAHGQQVMSVCAGTAFERHGPDRWHVRPGCADDYARLFDELHEQDRIPEHVLHLWCLDPAGESGVARAGFEPWQERGLYSLMYLLQAWGRHDRDQSLQLHLLVSETQNLGTETVAPNKATLLGMARIAPKEYKHVRCRTTDLPVEVATNATRQGALLPFVWADLHAHEPEDVVVYRDMQRWVRAFDAVSLGEVTPAQANVRSHGNYLLLGGLGTLGLDAAAFLVRFAPVHLIFADKKRLPARAGWVKEEGALQPLLQQLLAFEAAGARVTVVETDFASEADVERLVSSFSSQGTQLHGIVHAAGRVSNGLIERHTPESLRAVFAAKVGGAQVLRRILTHHQPDFVFLCSSMNPIIGSLGQLDKAAANAFLDCFADHLGRVTGLPVMAVSWGAVDDGRAAQAEVLPQFRELSRVHRMNQMSREESMEVYRRLLAGRIRPRVVVSTLRFEQVLEDWNRVGALNDLLSAKFGESTSIQEHNVIRTPGLDEICALFAEALGLPDIQAEQDFFALGGHSLSAISVIDALAARYGVRIRLDEIYRCSRPAALHRSIVARHRPGSDQTGAGVTSSRHADAV